jgi:hypothetical protein
MAVITTVSSDWRRGVWVEGEAGLLSNQQMLNLRKRVCIHSRRGQGRLHTETLSEGPRLRNSNRVDSLWSRVTQEWPKFKSNQHSSQSRKLPFPLCARAARERLQEMSLAVVQVSLGLVLWDLDRIKPRLDNSQRHSHLRIRRRTPFKGYRLNSLHLAQPSIKIMEVPCCFLKPEAPRYLQQEVVNSRNLI